MEIPRPNIRHPKRGSCSKHAGDYRNTSRDSNPAKECNRRHRTPPPPQEVCEHRPPIKAPQHIRKDGRREDRQDGTVLIRTECKGRRVNLRERQIRHHRLHGAEHRLALPLHQTALNEAHLVRHRDHAPRGTNDPRDGHQGNEHHQKCTDTTSTHERRSVNAIKPDLWETRHNHSSSGNRHTSKPPEPITKEC